MLGSSVSEAEKRAVMADLNAPAGAVLPPLPPTAPPQARCDPDDINSRPAEDVAREEEWEARRFRDGIPPPPQQKPRPPAPASQQQQQQGLLPGCPRLSVVFLSPELLCSSLGRSLLSSLLSKGRLPFVAIDEVHCVSSWGHNFRPSFLALKFLKATHPSFPLLLLTATATKEVQKDVLSVLGLDSKRIDTVRQGFNRPNIRYEVVHKETIHTMEGEEMSVWKHMARFIQKNIGVQQVAKAARKMEGPGVAGAKREGDGSATAAAASSVTAAPAAGTAPAAASAPSGSGIIYVSKREDCHTVSCELRKLHIASAPYHAGLSSKERSETQGEWMGNRISCIVATNAFGMGSAHTAARMQVNADGAGRKALATAAD